MTKSIAKKSPTGSLPPAVPLAITPMFSPWMHTSDDSYIYQLSLVVATATVSLILWVPGYRHNICMDIVPHSSHHSPRSRIVSYCTTVVVYIPRLLAVAVSLQIRRPSFAVR